MAILAYDDVMLREPNLATPIGIPYGALRYIGQHKPWLCHVYNDAMRDTDVVRGHPAPVVSTYDTGAYKKGVYSFPGGTSASATMVIGGLEALAPSITYTAGRTVLVVFRHRGAQADSGLYSEAKIGSRTTNQYTAVEVRLVSGKVRIYLADKQAESIYTETPAVAENIWHCAVCRWPAGSQSKDDLRIYVDGSMPALTTASSSTFSIADCTNSVCQPHIGRSNYAAATTYYSHNGEIACVISWMQDIGAEAARALSADPFSLFAPA